MKYGILIYLLLFIIFCIQLLLCFKCTQIKTKLIPTLIFVIILIYSLLLSFGLLPGIYTDTSSTNQIEAIIYIIFCALSFISIAVAWIVYKLLKVFNKNRSK